MIEVTKDMIISDIIAIDRGIIPILMQAGMHCIGCPASQGETLEEAVAVHGIDIEGLVNEINAYLATV